MMTTRRALILLSLVVLLSATTLGQTGKAIPRLADGKPDMQGYWTNQTFTPLERPAQFKDKAFFTAEEAQAFAKRALDDVKDVPRGDQVKSEILLASLEQLAEEQDIAPLAPPDINPQKIEIPEQGPFVYEFEVEVRPQFDLPDYKGLKLKRAAHTPTADEVADMRRRLLLQHGQIVPKPDGAVEPGDVITADFTFKATAE